MMKMVCRMVALTAVIGALACPVFSELRAADGERGSLILFVQSGAPVDEAFLRNQRETVETLCRDLGATFQVVDVASGAPEQVKLTPLFVYQNWRGRSVYQGRTTTPERLRTFLRTARRIPQGEVSRLAIEVPVRTVQRVQMAAPIKITDLAGAPPPGFDSSVFIEESRFAVAKSLTGYAWVDSIRLTRSDRSFYFDFYPHRSEQGQFSLGVALFSEFHCKDPVFQRTDTPLTGPWEKRAAVFDSAATLLAEAVERAVNDGDGGDGFTPVDAGVPIVSWDSLGLALPQPPSKAGAATGETVNEIDLEIPLEWFAREVRPDEPPAVQFRFPPPLDRYTGEAEIVTGTLSLGPEAGLFGATGVFLVPIASVTMGDKDLTATIRGAQFLNEARFPAATLRIDRVSAAPGRLRFGSLIPAEVQGTLTMKDRSLGVTIRAQVEVVLGEGGGPELWVSGSFQIRLADPFEMEGPLEGMPPASDTLLLDFQIALTGP